MHNRNQSITAVRALLIADTKKENTKNSAGHTFHFQILDGVDDWSQLSPIPTSLGFPTIIWNVNKSIHFKFGSYTYWVMLLKGWIKGHASSLQVGNLSVIYRNFPIQSDSSTESVSMPWRHHVNCVCSLTGWQHTYIVAWFISTAGSWLIQDPRVWLLMIRLCCDLISKVILLHDWKFLIHAAHFNMRYGLNETCT